jgi:hypothetical protein
MLLARLEGAGITQMEKQQAHYALAWYPEDLDKAYNLLVLANESFEGELKDYNPNTTMLGAINRNMVTCYLDALLFAMFARLDSFEAMLYDNFDDEPRKKLAAVLRLWVNLLRTGQLIKVELVGPPIHHVDIADTDPRQNTCKMLWPSVAGKRLPRSVNRTHPKHLLSSLARWSYHCLP